MPSNPLRLDPTRLGTIRRQFLADVNRRFRWLEKQVWRLVAVEDAFGLDKDKPALEGVINEGRHTLGLSHELSSSGLVTNKRWQFETSDKKMIHYQQWFKQQVDAGVLEVAGVPPKEPWTAEYVESSYKKGVTRAYIDSKPGLTGSIDFIEGSKAQFLNDAFNAPKGTAQIKMLGLRSFENLKGISPQMSQRMSEVLATGLAEGKGARALARDLTKQVKIGRKRALRVARTEIVHAHSEGQLDSFEKLGVEELGVMAEWSTAGDDLVCPLCLPMEGTVFTVKEARGIIPRHPNCRCAWIPSNVGEKRKGKNTTKSQVEAAIRKSIKAEFPGVKSAAERLARTQFRVAGKRISAAKRKVLRAKSSAARTAVRKVRKLRSAEDLAAPLPALFGNNTTGTIRWMGTQGWNFKEVSAVFDDLALDVADNTIKAQLFAGKKGKGIIPQLSEAQAKFFTDKRSTAIFQGVKKAKPKVPKGAVKAKGFSKPTGGPAVDKTTTPFKVGDKKFNLEKLTVDDLAGVREYQQGLFNSEVGGFTTLQDYLRLKKFNKHLLEKGVTVDKVKVVIGKVDSAIAKSVAAEDMTIFRGIRDSGNTFKISKLSDLKVGLEYSDEGYHSFSTTKKVSGKFADVLNPGDTPKTIHLQLKKGQTALPADVTKSLGEKEIIIPRSAKFRVTKIQGDNVFVELIEEVPKSVPKVGDFKGGSFTKPKAGTLNVEFHEGASASFKKSVTDAVNEVPEALLEKLSKTTLVKTGNKLPDVLPHLKTAASPKGWSPGSSWNDVTGVYSQVGGKKHKNIIALAEHPTYGTNKVSRTTLHEIGHAVDALDTETWKKSWRAAYKKDTKALAEHLKSQHHYVLQSGHSGPSEMFAETFAAKIGGKNSGGYSVAYWEEKFPTVSKWMDDFIAKKTGKLKVAKATGKVAKAPVKVVSKVVPPKVPSVVKTVAETVSKAPSFLDQPKTGIIRWMGSEGFNFKEVKFALQEAGIEAADNTIKAQLFAAKKGKGKIPFLNVTQKDYLKKQKALAVDLPKTPAKKKLAKQAKVSTKTGPPLTKKEADELGDLLFDQKAGNIMSEDQKDLLKFLKAKQAAAKGSSVPLKKPETTFKVQAPVEKLPEGKVGKVGGSDTFESGSKLKVVDSNIGGSTGAKLVRVTDTESDVTSSWIMKTYSGNESQARNEYLANRLYARVKGDGNFSPAPIAKLGSVDGRVAVFNSKEAGVRLSELNPAQLKLAKKVAADNLVMDAWLGNWDVVGQELDNMLFDVKGGFLSRVDNGGALLYRAKGAKKGAAFGDKVEELTTLRKGGNNPSANKIFGDVGDAELIDRIDDFESRIKESGGFKGLAKEIEGAGLDPAEAKEISDKLFNRYNDILRQRDVLKAKLSIKVEKGVLSKKAKAVVRGNRTDLDAAVRVAGLNANELDKIRKFTGGSYGSINKVALSGKVTTRIRALDNALEKMPGYTGWSARGERGLAAGKWNNWTSGKWAKVEWKAFSSSSVKPGSEFSQGSNGVTYLIKNKGKQGAYVKPQSSHPGEWEMMYKRNSEFRVIGWADNGPVGKERILLIEEVDTSIPASQVAPKKFDGSVLWEQYKAQAADAGFGSRVF